ncbi:taste receptor type 2 member 117-like [Chiroxiphia lanceolata]|uniref:taste receptor type 2 member 117-like n=1 Tax=Chiroxiphia lanceolata TaxID=296741 RepID=UPI0013CF3CEF|nr:taste receptor type 2 member 117-like [Chiroxiphia lanceolata]
MEACHSPEQSMSPSYAATAMATVTLEALAGMWINAFIVFVIYMAWVKKKTLNSNEKILLVLGCSRFWYLCISWVNYLLSVIYPKDFHVHRVLQLILSIYTFLNYFNLWVSACLCVFYCIKIANFRNNFFIYLKVKIDRIVPCLLLGSVLLALAISVLAYDIAEKLHSRDRNFTCPGNFWEESIKMEKHSFHISFITGFGYTASFLAVISSALLLLFSLWRHKRNMQTNSMKDLSVDAHIKAMKSILSFFVMYSINFICLILTIIYSAKNQNAMMFLVFMYLNAFPGVHSLILIFSNPKLENTLLRILPCMKLCMR